ncbi:MAG: efflux RND transporter permease subunit, partial [Planctomycetales bacterium]|nr:efflux RND transporter permease subunit [Planctomycetales bacterium]
MNVSALAMQYRPVVVTLVALLTGWGIVTFVTMPRREDPEFTIRTCVVSTQWPGAPTVKVEELITDKIEEALDSIEAVDYLKSETTNGQSIVYVNLEDGVPTAEIPNVWDKVRAKVDLVPMPAANIRPVVNDEFGDTSVLVLGIYQAPADGHEAVAPEHQYSARQLEVYADQVRDAIRLLPGVAKVEKHGVQDEAIFIETDLGTWSQLELTTSALRSLIQSRNIVAPGGMIDTEQGKFQVSPGGEFNAVDEIGALTVATVSNNNIASHVRLRDLGLDVRRSYLTPPQVICRFTDERGTHPAVMLGVTMKSGANIIDICGAAMEKIRQIVEVEQTLPRDIRVLPVSNLADNVSRKISDVIANVVSAIVIVVIVVYLFVGLRTAIVMAANIPIVVLASIAVIRQFGVQLEQISLASIIIALGLLVDNAVQVCDQTRTNILAGMTPREAAVRGAKTLMFPMLSGTLTTIAAFFPMLLALEGGGSEYVYSLPVTLSTTLLLSWFFAMTICVILAAAFIRAPQNRDIPDAPLPWLNYRLGRLIQRWRARRGDSAASPASQVQSDNLFLQLYGKSAQQTLSFKWISVAIAVGLLIATLQLPVSSEFFPKDRRDQFFVNVRLPETATIHHTSRVVAQVESALRKLSPYRAADGAEIDRLRTMRSLIGKGGSRWALGVDPPPPGPNAAEILVRTTDGRWTDSLIADLRAAVESGNEALQIQPIPGAQIVAKQLALGPPSPPVELRVTGDGFADITRLRQIAGEVRSLIRAEPGTWNVTDSWGIDGFQLDVEVNQERANLSGVSSASIADTLNAYFSGVKLTEYREGDHTMPIFFRLRAEDRQDLSGIDRAFVEGANGKVPLNSVASITTTWQPGKIERRNQNR